MIIAHICAAAGLVLLTVLPELFADPFVGILMSVVIYAVGGGLLEAAMSLLHSFYCWGCTGVVLFSTVFFALFGTEHWKILTLLWVIIPVCNMILFTKVPIYSLHEEGEKGMTMGELFREKVFWFLMIMMVCSGASEQAVSQWASTFAEQGLGITKTIGDLVGPMAFSILMGTSRLIYGKYGDRFDLDQFMKLSTLLCIGSYLLIAFVPVPADRHSWDLFRVRFPTICAWELEPRFLSRFCCWRDLC